MRILFTAALTFLFSFSLFGETSFIHRGKVSQLEKTGNFRPFVYFIRDAEGADLKEKIISENEELPFRNVPSEMVAFGFTEDTLWLYAPLENDSEKDYYGKFEIYNPYLEEVDISYRYDKGHKIHEIAAGANRVYPENYPTLDFYLRPGETIRIVCRIKSGTPLRIPIVLESEKKYGFTKQFRSIIVGLTLGFGIAMSLYNLSLYFFFRAKSYFYYFIMISLFTAYLTAWDGLLLPLFRPYYGNYYLPGTLFLIYSATLFLFLFAIEFLYPEKKDKRAEVVSAVYILANLFFFPLSFLFPIVSNQLSYYWALFNNLLIVYFCFKRIQEGFKPAKILLLIHLIFPTAAVVTNLSATGVISINYFSLHILKIAFITQSILFSIILVQRIKELEFKLTEGLQSEIHKNIVLLKKEIQQRRETEWELIQAKEIAENASKVKGSFLANMSHEIRTPMNGVLGMVQLLGTTKLTGEQKEYINTLSGSAKSLLQIINDILDFSKIEAGKIVLDKEVFSIRSVLDEIHDLLQPLAQVKKIGFQLEGKFEIQEYVSGDQLRLRQILWNLAGNAIKFTVQGGVVLKVSQRKTSDQKVEIEFTVSDTGIGIPEDKQKQVFDAFSQTDSSTARKFGGSGLGLSITKQLVELQGGILHLESKEGQGSKFGFSIVYDIPSEAEIESILKPETISDFGEIHAESILKKTKILVAEDNETNCLLIERILKKLGYDPAVVHNGREVVERMQIESFDLILMDIHMPEVDGIEATRWIRSRKENSELPVIIALTADAIESSVERYQKLGMNDCLIKPLDLAVLKKTLDRWIDKIEEKRRRD